MNFSILRSALAIAAAIACTSLHTTSALGVCYDPEHVDYVTPETVDADMSRIKAEGFDAVRTYYVEAGPINLPRQALAKGMNVCMTIPYDNANPEASKPHIYAAIDAVHYAKELNNGARVQQIMVGNENLANVDEVPREMIDYVWWLQNECPETEIGTVQRNTEYLDKSRQGNIRGFQELIAACDVAGVNLHTCFTPSTRGENAMWLVEAQWKELHSDEVNAIFPGVGEKIAITETGWPSGGSLGGNYGSPDSAKAYFDQFRAWQVQHLADDRAYFFQMFDQPHKSFGFEPYFGLNYADGRKKFDVAM